MKERERKGCYQGPTATRGSAMRQGEIVQCQGYMSARAQNRPYAEERQGGSGQEQGKTAQGREKGAGTGRTR